MDDDPIVGAEAALREAQLAGDVTALDRPLDDQLMFTALDGTVVGKADDLDLHRSGRLRITRMVPNDLRIIRLGSVAVVSVRMDAAAIVNGTQVSGPLRYTRVWRECPDGWRIVAGHISAVQGDGGSRTDPTI
jgi:hypothetical protein